MSKKFNKTFNGDANAFGITGGTDSVYHLNTLNNTQSRPISAKTGKRIKVSEINTRDLQPEQVTKSVQIG